MLRTMNTVVKLIMMHMLVLKFNLIAMKRLSFQPHIHLHMLMRTFLGSKVIVSRL